LKDCYSKLISRSATCSWLNIFVDPGTSFRPINQICGTRLQFMSSFASQPGLDASTSVIYLSFLLILGISYG